MKSSKKLVATAHHEAGHAVAAWRHHLRFSYVTIKPKENSLGHILPKRAAKWFSPEIDLDDRMRLRAETHIITLFAGQIAEAKFRCHRLHYRSGIDSDNKQAVIMALHLCNSTETAAALLNYCYCASRDIVNVFWKQVEAVASALLQRQTLTYEEMVEILWPGITR